MARFEDRIELMIDGQSIELRPTLRAALTLSREFGGVKNLLSGISEGSITVLSRVVRECLSRNALADPLSSFDGRPYSLVEAALKPSAFQLVDTFISPFLDENPAPRPATKPQGNPKPFYTTQTFEDLFGFATGILKWTPEAAWNATPGEIMAAMRFREKAYAPKDGKKGKDETPHDKLTLGQQARKLFANIGTRVEKRDNA